MGVGRWDSFVLLVEVHGRYVTMLKRPRKEVSG
jgi:hypothetical protein